MERHRLENKSSVDAILCYRGDEFLVYEDEDAFEADKPICVAASLEEAQGFIRGVAWVITRRLFGGYKT